MDLIDWEKGGLHFVGLAGSGMAPLASFLAKEGYEIQGSDRQFGKGLEEEFIGRGMKCFAQDGSGIMGGKLFGICVSSAIEESNPDVQEALKLNLPIFHRAEVLAWVISRYKTIAIAGTSGKSTTTALTHHLLQSVGVDASLITGAPLESLPDPGNFHVGSSEYLVVEVDESDGTLVYHHPEVGVILNVDRDHKELEELDALFKTFRSHCKKVVVNRDDARAFSYSQNQNWDFGADPNGGMKLEYQGAQGWNSRFTFKGKSYELPLPGSYNVDNLAAAAAALRVLGFDVEKAFANLGAFKGVWRRAQLRRVEKNFWVMDDFAHNPVKVKSMIVAAQERCEKLFAWFQPHGFGPTKFMRAELKEVLKEVLRPQDHFSLGEIYYAGGTVAKDISSNDLVEEFTKEGVYCSLCPKSSLVNSLKTFGLEGTGVLLMGARDPSLKEFSKQVAESL